MRTRCAGFLVVGLVSVFATVGLSQDGIGQEYLKTEEQHSFAITDQSVIFIDPEIPEFYKGEAPIRITQTPEVKPYLMMLDKDGKPIGYASVPDKDWRNKVFGSISGPLIFLHGARHLILGKVSLGKGYVLESSEDDPLLFECDKEKGYVYRSGKGTVTLPDNRVIVLGPKHQ